MAKAIYKSHGEEFDTPEAAEKNDKIVEASRVLQEAWEKLRAVNLEGYLTADGEQIRFDRWKDYYVVRGEYFHLEQSIERVSLTTDRVKAIEVDGDDIKFHVYQYDVFSNSNTVHEREFWLSEIYATEEGAERKIVEIMERNIDFLQTTLAKKKAPLNGKA